MNNPDVNQGVTASIWFLYAAIVFEILFMISPFAAYYYSVYAVPLNAITNLSSAAWLTQHILPHFVWHTSTLANFMIGISFPLIFLGLLMFFIAFVQIYWAKFTNKGAVDQGLYQCIRHPQYVALAIVGLGTTMFWSRYLILISFVTMLYLYYLLARVEEARCLAAYGETYQRYMDKTGRFLPRQWTTFLPKVQINHFTGFVIYLVVLVASIAGASVLRNHVLENSITSQQPNYLLISLAPVTNLDQITATLNNEDQLMRSLEDQEAMIAYLVPAAWQIPELGLKVGEEYNLTGGDELMHPSHHGNNPELVDDNWRILFAQPEFIGQPASGIDLLLQTRRIEPKFLVELKAGRIEAIDNSPAMGRWAGVPVPIY